MYQRNVKPSLKSLVSTLLTVLLLAVSVSTQTASRPHPRRAVIEREETTEFDALGLAAVRAAGAKRQRPSARGVNVAESKVKVRVSDVGPEVGIGFNVEGFIINRDNPKQIIFPTSTRMFRSDDGGSNWFPLDLADDSGTSLGTFYLRQDPGNPEKLFVVSGIFSSVYRSEDFGTTWTRIETGFPYPIDCAINEAASNEVLVLNREAQLGEGVLWKSVDGGATFEPVSNSGLPEVTYDPDTGHIRSWPQYLNIETTPADPNIVYVVQDSDHLGYYPPSIYKSVDGGETFTRLEGSPPRPAQVFPHPTQPNVLFVQDWESPSGIYRSVDGGASFQLLTAGLPPGEFILVYATFDPHNPSFVYVAGAGGVFRSTDGGDTFRPLGLTEDQLIYAAFGITVDPFKQNVLYVNTGAGNFKSDNGGLTFRQINRGWRASDIRHITFDNASRPSLYVAAAHHGVLRTRNRGQSYEQIAKPSVFGSTASLLAVAPTEPNVLFVGAFLRGLFKSTDSGRTWTRSSIDTGSILFVDHWSEIAFDPMNPNNIYFVSSFVGPGFYRSTDAGLTFRRTAIDLDIYQGFAELAIDPINPNVIYTGYSMYNAPLKSVDGGGSFATGPLFYGGIEDIAIDPKNPKNVYLAGSFQLNEQDFEIHSVVRSSDGGATYSAADAGLSLGLPPELTPAFFTEDMVIDPQNPARLFLFSNVGLFMTEDGGASWSLLD